MASKQVKLRPLEPDQLGTFGERRFAAICAEAGLVCHKSDPDRNGWDFFVEFPPLAAELDTDIVAQKQLLQCFVQVKTLWEGGRYVDLGLSAATRLGNRSLPAFVCIFVVAEPATIAAFHVLHMAGPLLERVFIQLRRLQAKHQSTLINRAHFNIPVPPSAHGVQPTGHSLLRALEEAIGSDLPMYQERKNDFLKTSGFSTRRLKGAFTLRVESEAQYKDFKLGSISLPVSDFKAVEVRWNIGIPIRFDGQPVSVKLTPEPLDVEAVWQRVGFTKQIRLGMQAVAASGYSGTGQMGSWLLRHPNLELRVDDGSFAIKFLGPSKVPTSFVNLVKLHGLEEMLATDGAVDVRLLYQGKLILAWQHEEPVQLRPAELTDSLGELLSELKAVLLAAGMDNIQLPCGPSDEWQEQLRYLFLMLNSPYDFTLSIELAVKDEQPQLGDAEALYVSAFAFGEFVLAHYSTCRATITKQLPSRPAALRMKDFIVRDIRLLEKSDAARRAYAEEAETVTGLNTVLINWCPSPSQLK